MSITQVHIGAHLSLPNMIVTWNFRFPIEISEFSFEFPIWWTPEGLIDVESKLVNVMAQCQAVPKHYLNQRWSSQLTHICVNVPPWVNVDSDVVLNVITGLQRVSAYIDVVFTPNTCLRVRPEQINVPPAIHQALYGIIPASTPVDQ